MIFRKISLFVVLFGLLFSAFQSMAQEVERRTTKNDIKVTLLSLGSGSSRFTYERAFTPKHSAEITVGIIGWGWDFMHKTDSHGFLFKGAFKWNLIPMKNATSWLAGFYLKPEFVAASFRYSPKAEAIGADYPKRTLQFALLGECGYQVVVRWFVFDVYAGMGPSLGTGNDNNYYHSFIQIPRDWPVAFTSGFRIGVAF